MKREDVLKKLKKLAKEQGVSFRVIEGSRHTRVAIGNRWTTVPRHKEVDEDLARLIFKQAKGK